MSSTKSQVAVATNIPNLSSTQSQKDYNSTEEHLGRQNNFANNRRGTMKGKHLTRSHAMRESTSPPRTPTPRADHAQVSPNGLVVVQNYSGHHQQQQQQQQQHGGDGSDTTHNNNNNNNTNNNNNNNSSNTNNNNNITSNNNNNNNNNKLHAQSTANRGNSPIEAPAVIVTSQHNSQQPQPQQPQQQQQQQQSQQQQQQHSQQQQSPPSNAVLCNDAEFPKLTPPKSKSQSNSSSSSSSNGGSGGAGGVGQRNSNANTNGPTADVGGKMEYTNHTNSSNSGNSNNNGKKHATDLKANGGNETHKANGNNNNNNSNKHHQQQYGAGTPQHHQQSASIYNSGMNYHAADVQQESRCPRNDSQNSYHNTDDEHHYERSGSGGGIGGGGGAGNRKHRTNSNSKGSKPRLKNLGSSGSMEGNSNSNSTSGFISRVYNNSENSGDHYMDHHGACDLVSFFRDTINKNPKDRALLMRIEKDLIDFLEENTRLHSEFRFPPASSYNRMLMHRTAAFFGMEHNLDETQQCVIVGRTKSTRIPEIRFKTLIRDCLRDETRKSILKRDTHSFDEPRQSSYLCPDRGMLDRKAKSFEEREEDYERARSRIFNRSQQQQHQQQQQNDGGDLMEDSYMNWPNIGEQQHRSRPNGKILKMQTSMESRDGRSGGGAIPKGHSFVNYNGPPPTGGPPSTMLRGDAGSSNKNGGGGRGYGKQDSTGSGSSAWRLSPSSSGSIYHYDPSNLPPSQAMASAGVYHPNPASSPSAVNYTAHHQPPNQMNMKKGKPLQLQPPQQQLPPATQLPSAQPQQQQQQPQMASRLAPQAHPPPQSQLAAQPASPQPQLQLQPPPTKTPPAGDLVVTATANSSLESTLESASSGQSQPQDALPHSPKPSNETKEQQTDTEAANDNVSGNGNVNNSADSGSVSGGVGGIAYAEENSHEEVVTPSQSGGGDECDNSATSCLSVATTTSIKHCDHMEVQKFKNQATSPNIPHDDKDEMPKRESSVSTDASSQRVPSRNQQPPVSQTPSNTSQNHRETPHSARSTPLTSVGESNLKRASEEPKPTTWTYTQSYQAPDGSTIFQTTTTPSGSPYCTTTYQQGPDGSVYAIPQSMVYTYPPPVEGEVQGYFMPVFDPNQPRADAPGLIPAGAQAIYPAAGGTTTMVPVAYPTPQFATANGTPIYPGQVIYSSEQFTPGGAPVTTAAPAAPPVNGQLQQIPMTTYPIGYPYPYNGYWGQAMTYYVPQQTLTNAVAAAPLLPAAPPPAPPPPPPPAATVTGPPHVAGGVSIPNGLIQAAPSAAGPPSSTAAASNGVTVNGAQLSGGTLTTTANGTPTYHAPNGTTYFGTNRIKRPAAPHYNGPGPQSSGPHQIVAAIPSNGGTTTTYQLTGHAAVPTLTLAAPATAAGAPAAAAVAAPNDLNGTSAAPTVPTMYALPQPATIFPANMFPYAATAATAGAPPAQPHPAGAVLASAAAQHANLPGSGTAHTQQSNAVITPFYAHPPPMHAPGPTAIPIVDPNSLANTTANVNGSVSQGAVSNASQSAPSTPHSLSSQIQQRNPPLFPTPPITNCVSSAGGGGGSSASGTYSSSSTPNYYTPSEQQNHGGSSGSPHNSYVSSYEKRNNSHSHAHAHAHNNHSNNMNSNVNGKKPPSYPVSGQVIRQVSTSSSYNSTGKTGMLSGNNDTRSSPSSTAPHTVSISNGYQGQRPHLITKRINDKPQTQPLLNGPPTYAGVLNPGAPTVYHHHHVPPTTEMVGGKPPVRLNAGAASFRQKPSGIEYRRNGSQRNSPGTNSSSNESNNNSPNSIATAPVPGTITPLANCYTPSYVTAATATGGSIEQQVAATASAHPAPASLYITRSTHIPPPQMQHGGAVAGGTVAAVAASGAAAAAAEVANAAAAAAAASVAHHQPLLGTYNPGASGVYFKYGQTYFAHPSVALPNSRRSPSTDIRAPMAQMAGMYPTVNMMIPAPPRHAPGRHPNPNYKGTRPR